MDKKTQAILDYLIQLLTEPITRSILDQLQGSQIIVDAPNHQKNVKAKYLTLPEAAQYLKIATQTLYTLTSKRAIKFIKVSKKILFTEEDLEEYLSKGKKETRHSILSNLGNEKGVKYAA